MPRKKKAIKKAKPAPVKEGKKTGKRYSDKRKQALLARYNELRKGGKNTTDAAKAVGVPYMSLSDKPMVFMMPHHRLSVNRKKVKRYRSLGNKRTFRVDRGRIQPHIQANETEVWRGADGLQLPAI